MRNATKASCVGVACGLVVSLASIAAITSLLLQYAGMDDIPPDSTPGAVLGAVWAVGWGLVAGAALGLISCAITTAYYYRRLNANSGRRAEDTLKSARRAALVGLICGLVVCLGTNYGGVIDSWTGLRFISGATLGLIVCAMGTVCYYRRLTARLDGPASL